MISKKKLPEDIKEIRLGKGIEPLLLVKLLAANGIVVSNGEGRRLIKQGAVKVNGEKISDINFKLKPSNEYLIKVGKRRFVKFITN